MIETFVLLFILILEGLFFSAGENPLLEMPFSRFRGMPLLPYDLLFLRSNIPP